VWRSRTIRFTAKPTKGPKVLRQRDEVSILVAGTAHYKVEDMRTAVGPRDFLFAVRQWDCRRDGEVIGTKQHRHADKTLLVDHAHLDHRSVIQRLQRRSLFAGGDILIERLQGKVR
jgi:hypothetical protein